MSEEHKDTNTKATAVQESTEDDLDDLDELLDDFAGEVLSKPPGSTVLNDANVKEEAEVDEPINDEFKGKLEDLIKELNIQDPETKGQFEQLVKNFEEDTNNESPKDPKDFDSIMKNTMERLKNSGKDIDEQIKNDQSSSNPEDMLTQLLSGLGGGESGDLDMSKLLVDMLEQLSSKEVLYEPIKDLNTKFPDYLKEKKDVITQEEHANYTKQYEITNDIVAIFESSTFSDENKEQRDKVNSLLESLQELGQPPSDLIGDAGDFPGFGGLGAPGVGAEGLNFSDKDLPKDFEKELEEGCK
ncbi:Pex19 protein, partial [Yamadazyma tenuis ATCC 10573]